MDRAVLINIRLVLSQCRVASDPMLLTSPTVPLLSKYCSLDVHSSAYFHMLLSMQL